MGVPLEIVRRTVPCCLALHLGMAVLDHSPGTRTGAKRSRQVNTRAKAAMMIAVARHMEQAPASRTYYL